MYECILSISRYIKKIAILIAILTVTFLPYAIICAHALPCCFSSRYLHYMFFATIIYSLLLFSLSLSLSLARFEQCKCCTSFYSDRWVFVVFLGYIGCVCVWAYVLCDIFFWFDFSICCFICYPVNSESPKKTISKICSLAFLSTAKNALNLEFSALTPFFDFFTVHFLCLLCFVYLSFFGNFTVSLCNVWQCMWCAA